MIVMQCVCSTSELAFNHCLGVVCAVVRLRKARVTLKEEYPWQDGCCCDGCHISGENLNVISCLTPSEDTGAQSGCLFREFKSVSYKKVNKLLPERYRYLGHGRCFVLKAYFPQQCADYPYLTRHFSVFVCHLENGAFFQQYFPWHIKAVRHICFTSTLQVHVYIRRKQSVIC